MYFFEIHELSLLLYIIIDRRNTKIQINNDSYNHFHNNSPLYCKKPDYSTSLSLI